MPTADRQILPPPPTFFPRLYKEQEQILSHWVTNKDCVDQYNDIMLNY